MVKNDNQVVIFFRLISLVFILFFGITGCAGPIMQTIPTKPFVIETDPKETPQNVELFFESTPGEVIKYDMFFKAIGQAKGKSVDSFGSGHMTLLTENISSTKDITMWVTLELLGGVIGQPLIKTKENCRIIFSNKGMGLFTNCPDNEDQNLFQTLPDGFISVGSQWNQLADFVNKDFGKIQVANSCRLSKFALIDNRLCARIDIEGKMPSQLVSEEFTIISLKSKGFYYHDIKLGIHTYFEGLISMEVFLNNIKEKLNLTIEFIGKLDFKNSVFKRTLVEYSTPLKTKFPLQEVDIITSMVVVTGTSANIRSRAGDEFLIVTTVKQGDRLTLLGEKGDWFHVRLENGQEGWINKKFVK